jgi:HSP20 family protein
MTIKDLIPWNWGKRETPVRRETTNPLGALQSNIDRAFEDFWRAFDLPISSTGRDGFPGVTLPVDVRETDRAVEVTAELPGMDEKDVEVSVAEGVLTIRGKKESERASEEKGYFLRERTFGSVERVVPLPDGLDPDSAKATFKNGVLAITIPKTSEAQAAMKRIPVQRR